MFPGAKIVKLEQNYRSTKTILAAANAVIANNKQRHGKTLWSQLGDGELDHARGRARPPRTRRSGSRARSVALHEGRPARGATSRCCIARTSRRRSSRRSCAQPSVPYVMYGGQQFFERKEVKDVIAYLRVALNPRDELALRRDHQLSGARHRRDHRREAGRARAHDASARRCGTRCRTLDRRPPAPREDRRSSRVRSTVDRARHAATALDGRPRHRRRDASALIEDIALYDDLRDASREHGAAQRRIDNVEGLLGSLERFTDEGPRASTQLAEYLRQLSLDRATTTKRRGHGDKVVLTTLHGAKGLEFPVCFMIGLEEELLPHARTLNPQVDRRDRSPITRPTSARSAGSATSASRARSASST